jgi:transcriptional regulator with XRE-family HTH domain
MAVPDFSAILAGLAQNGMSQADIARRLHLDPSTICRVINGEIRQPSYSTGSKILTLQAKSLGSLVSTHNRFGGK